MLFVDVDLLLFGGMPLVGAAKVLKGGLFSLCSCVRAFVGSEINCVITFCWGCCPLFVETILLPAARRPDNTLCRLCNVSGPWLRKDKHPAEQEEKILDISHESRWQRTILHPWSRVLGMHPRYAAFDQVQWHAETSKPTVKVHEAKFQAEITPMPGIDEFKNLFRPPSA